LLALDKLTQFLLRFTIPGPSLSQSLQQRLLLLQVHPLALQILQFLLQTSPRGLNSGKIKPVFFTPQFLNYSAPTRLKLPQFGHGSTEFNISQKITT
jgi:hypothetical protein